MTNDTQTLTLTEFLLARLDQQRTECEGTAEYGGCDEVSEFAERAVEALRRSVGLHAAITLPEPCCQTCDDVDADREEAAPYPCPTLRSLALPYAAHPDYQQEWKP